MLNPTPNHLLLDPQGRPYFLWDSDMTEAEFRAALEDPDAQLRAVLIAKLMRQAKPDDVFRYVSAQQVRELWASIEPHLGSTRAFWAWLLDVWRRHGAA